MVVYKPKNRTTSSNVVQDKPTIPNCDCHPHHHHHHCDDAIITIEVDGSPEITPDVVYGPPGKNGTINGYNEVTINGGHNIDVVTERNNITINSITYVNDIDAEPCCNCDECECFEQVKPNSCWKIVHNLNKYPSVTVVTEEGEEIQCEVKYISINEVHLKFNGRFRGKAYLN